MTREKMYIIGALSAVVIFTVWLLIRNAKKTALKGKIDEINVRFNQVKSAPLAFKLNKAQTMAKRNQETSSAVADYYTKFEGAQKHIDQVQELLNNLEDQFALKKYKDVSENIEIVSQSIGDCENEISVIDQFLEQFQKEEVAQREYSTRLKEQFRDLKIYISEHATPIAYSAEGLEQRIIDVENLFSSSEEWLYANDFVKAHEDLERIESEIGNIRVAVESLPELIKDVKGIVPLMIDEVSKEYALARQKGIYVAHLDIDNQLETIKNNQSIDNKMLLAAQILNVKEHASKAKELLTDINSALEAENESYTRSKETIEEIKTNIDELKRLHAYVKAGYEINKDRFGLDDLTSYLDNEIKVVKDYEKVVNKLSGELTDAKTAPTVIFEKVNNLYNETEIERKRLLSYKMTIDQTSADEQRAILQLQKLQVVVNEVEIKVKEYRLPTISEGYYEDLSKGKGYINQLKKLLEQIPINVETLNKTLEEAIDFIYTLYNNVNNIVGMAIMVENAIVFGNKYRSNYPEIDRELSKAEFSYINGEYTKALTIAISCMETLFPKQISDEKFLETA